MRSHWVCLLCLPDFTQRNALQVHPCRYRRQSFPFWWLSHISVCVCVCVRERERESITTLSIHQLTELRLLLCLPIIDSATMKMRKQISFWLSVFLKILLIYFQRETERVGEKHWRARETSVSCPAHPGMCPDWELNRYPFSSQASTQSTEPHQPGPD